MKNDFAVLHAKAKKAYKIEEKKNEASNLSGLLGKSSQWRLFSGRNPRLGFLQKLRNFAWIYIHACYYTHLVIGITIIIFFLCVLGLDFEKGVSPSLLYFRSSLNDLGLSWHCFAKGL